MATTPAPLSSEVGAFRTRQCPPGAPVPTVAGTCRQSSGDPGPRLAVAEVVVPCFRATSHPAGGSPNGNVEIGQRSLDRHWRRYDAASRTVGARNRAAGERA